MMDHETWRRNLVSVIRDLADAGYQERVWVRGAGPEVDSMNEAISRFFDDYDVDGFLAASARGSILSAGQQASLTTLRDALDAFHRRGRINDRSAIRQSEWRKIQELAAEALSALSNGMSGQREPLAQRS